MNITNSQIRAKARAALGGNIFAKNWLMALVALVIVSAISGIAAAIPVAGSIAAIIISGPFSVGLAFVFLKLVRTGTDVSLEETFEGFKKDFSKNLVLGIMSSIFIFLWTLLFIIPGLIKTYSYSMCFYIKNDHPEYDWKQCITESRKMMMGKKWKLFCLDLSFIGWAFLSILTLGIGFIWLIPYQEAAYAAFYRDICPAKVAEPENVA